MSPPPAEATPAPACPRRSPQFPSGCNPRPPAPRRVPVTPAPLRSAPAPPSAAAAAGPDPPPGRMLGFARHPGQTNHRAAYGCPRRIAPTRDRLLEAALSGAAASKRRAASRLPVTPMAAPGEARWASGSPAETARRGW